MIKSQYILSRRFIVWPIYASLVLRMVMPVGYMPAPLADGLPFVPCPAGLVGGDFFTPGEKSSSHHQHSGHDAAGGEHSPSGGGESCQFGGAFGAAAPVAEPGQTLHVLEQVPAFRDPAANVQSCIPLLYRARAPPQQLIQA